MRFKYNRLNFITSIIFVVAFLCLMLSYVTSFLYVPAMLFFAAGFVMLSFIFVKGYIATQKEIEQRQEAIVMELASGEDGETYVMQDESNNKKMRRRKRSQSFERLLPSIFSVVVALFMIYMFISSFIKLFI